MSGDRKPFAEPLAIRCVRCTARAALAGVLLLYASAPASAERPQAAPVEMAMISPTDVAIAPSRDAGTPSSGEGGTSSSAGSAEAVPQASTSPASPTATAGSTVPRASSTAEDALDLEIEQQPEGFPDPFERVNRNTFAFNQRLDGWVISPIARTYGYVVPDPVKTGVRNFLSNLAAPVRLVNDLLQAEWRGASLTLARFAINTVAGGAGLVDTASYVGIDPHDSDFGQTLARGGMSSGPYLIVPLLGPTTVRDGFGALVDTALNPSLYLTGGVSPIVTASIETGANGIAEREQHDRDLTRLQEGSIDGYAALRSAYYQNRMAELREHAGNLSGSVAGGHGSVVVGSASRNAAVVVPATAAQAPASPATRVVAGGEAVASSEAVATREPAGSGVAVAGSAEVVAGDASASGAGDAEVVLGSSAAAASPVAVPTGAPLSPS